MVRFELLAIQRTNTKNYPVHARRNYNIKTEIRMCRDTLNCLPLLTADHKIMDFYCLRLEHKPDHHGRPAPKSEEIWS